ncbi:hypothetical protein Tco_0494897 [Tanacetum coccineum]
MSFSKHQVNDAVYYTKPLDSLKSRNDHFFWVDAFACPASFSWNTSKSVSKDPFPKSSEFNAKHYATLIAYPAPFHKYPEPFVCLVEISRNYTLDEDTYPQFLCENGEEMDLLSFIQTVDPTKVRVGERQRAKDKPRLLDTIVGRIVPLLPIAHAPAESELDASVDKLFDECGNGNQAEQGDYASGGHGVGIQLVSEAAEIVVEDATPVQPRRQRKRKTIVSDAGGPSHPPKKLRGDHGTLSGASIGGKSMSVVQRLLAGAVQNAEIRGEPIPTLPFVTSSVSATSDREDEAHTASATGLNLRTIGAPLKFFISSDSSHRFGANIVEAKFDSFARPSVPLMTVATTVTSTVDPATTVKEKFVESSVFGGNSSGGGADHTACHDGRTCCEMVDEFAPPKFFASIRGMEHDQLFTEFNVGAAHQMCLSAEVRMRAEYNIRERRRLNSGAEVAEAIHLRAEASKFKVVEESLRDEVKVLKEQNAALEQEKTDLSVKVADLVASVKVHEPEMALHLEEKFYPRLLTTIYGHRWLLTHDMELAIAKCLNSTEYLSTLGAAIGKAVEKGMQEGLSARITHGAEGRKLTDVAAYNPSEVKQSLLFVLDIMGLLLLLFVLLSLAW